ncbi:unnamed protein product [Cuscuta epithymum]|uniref:Uncharacterized protein n=1 Tax=Cuscuta epithymum TaxID=186058 RepID=A0AAV0CG11_9ASTE|nr:unnamed protein product [Cuscuta epithymum]
MKRGAASKLMAGRNYLPPSALNLRGDPPEIADRRIFPPRPRLQPSVILEELVASQHREIQALSHERQGLAASHVRLKRKLAAAQKELQHLSAIASAVEAEEDARVREAYEESLRIEAQVLALNKLRNELAQVNADTDNMSARRKDLVSKLNEIEDALMGVLSDLVHILGIKAKVETMHKELQRGRDAVKYERKMKVVNLKQSGIMEMNMVRICAEIERLRVEVVDAEKRAMAAAAASLTPSSENLLWSFAQDNYETPEGGYGEKMCLSPCAAHQFHVLSS